jgi:uncharacterized protein YjbI with pentapeptide repeats
MKRLVLAAAIALIAAPAVAQNAGQIASARGGASCAGCNLFQADFTSVDVSGRNFAGARLRQSNLGLATMNRTNFSGADLRDVNGYAGVFSSSNFAKADLSNSTWVGAFLEGANFQGANLSGANFSGAELSRARGLTQRQLDAACGDQATQLPSGFRLPACR